MVLAARQTAKVLESNPSTVLLFLTFTHKHTPHTHKHHAHTHIYKYVCVCLRIFMAKGLGLVNLNHGFKSQLPQLSRSQCNRISSSPSCCGSGVFLSFFFFLGGRGVAASNLITQFSICFFSFWHKFLLNCQDT